ncbi:MAG: sulfatase-like hydrolase/transferase [Verrucomicrobia bacterium]|nr:sulfatase-like hydrolase/transferase [Verrucomicrobiota bacterium]
MIRPTILLATLATALPWTTLLADAGRPNLILIVTDDQRADELGCTGNPVVQTPNLDRLAADGTLFTQATVTSAVCTPSRASIFTGMHERRHGINFNSGTALSPAAWQQTYPMLLRKAGYFIGYIGKNHVPLGARGYETGLMDASFDYWYGGHEHLLFYPKNRPAWAIRVKGIDEHVFDNAKSDTQVEVLQEGVENFLNPHQDFYNRAARFLEKRPHDRPFCLSICFNLPHDAGTGSMADRPSDSDLYKTAYHGDRDAIRANLPATYTAKTDIKNPKLPRELLRSQFRQKSYDYVDTPEDLVERIVRRYQALTGIDNFVGKLRSALVAAGLDKNTVILFVSDHGIQLGEFGLGGKGLCYDASLRVPLIAYDPRSDVRGQRRSEQVQTIDLTATLLDYAGMEIPPAMSGRSLAPLIRGEQVTWREYAFSENLWSTRHGNPRSESVRGDGWKYIRYFQNDASLFAGMTDQDQQRITDRQAQVYRKWLDASIHGEMPVHEELFDLKTDPGETLNLAGDSKYAEKLEELRSVCARMVKEARGDASVQPHVLPLESERILGEPPPVKR